MGNHRTKTLCRSPETWISQVSKSSILHPHIQHFRPQALGAGWFSGLGEFCNQLWTHKKHYISDMSNWLLRAALLVRMCGVVRMTYSNRLLQVAAGWSALTSPGCAASSALTCTAHCAHLGHRCQRRDSEVGVAQALDHGGTCTLAQTTHLHPISKLSATSQSTQAD